MIGYVIKFNDGSYYAGYNKKPSKDIKGAKIYRSYNQVNLTIVESQNFKKYCNGRVWKIVRVKIEEIEAIDD